MINYINRDRDYNNSLTPDISSHFGKISNQNIQPMSAAYYDANCKWLTLFLLYVYAGSKRAWEGKPGPLISPQPSHTQYYHPSPRSLEIASCDVFTSSFSSPADSGIALEYVTGVVDEAL